MENGKYELFPGIYANKGQTEALDMLYDFLKSDKIAFILQGRGGTGKTTIIKKMIQNYPGNIGGMAISHKAKKVLGRSIGKENVMTLASALCIKLDENTGEFTPDEYKRKNLSNIPITKLKLILVDEASQISIPIINEIKKFKTSGAKIIFIGDDAQLPPIGEDNISSVFKIKNSYTLVEKMRQAATSPIINIGEIVAKNGLSESPLLHALSAEHRVNKYDDESGSEVLFESNEEKVLDMFAEDFKRANDNVDYCKMVTFNNHLHKSSQSVRALNIKIRKKIWGENSAMYNKGEMLTAYDGYSKSELVKTRSKTFVKQTPLFDNSEDFIVLDVSAVVQKDVNLEHDQYSKVTGKTVTHFFNKTYESYDLTVLNKDSEVTYTVPVLTELGKSMFDSDLQELWKRCKKLYFEAKSVFANLQYAYAITSHKAQGSTYINTYVFEDNILGNTNGSTVEAKNQALYVAVSRPRKKLVILSSRNPVNGKSAEKPEVATFKIDVTEYIKATMIKEGEEIAFIGGDGYKNVVSVIDMLIYRADQPKGRVTVTIEKENGDIKTIKKNLK